MQNSKLLFSLFIVLTVGFELFGDFLFKKWSLSNNNGTLWFGVLMYGIGTIFWALSLRHETLSQAIAVFVVVTVVGAALIGSIFFGEQLSIPNKIGILLGLMSVMLVEY